MEYVFTLSPSANGIVFAIDGEQFPLQRQGVQTNNPMSLNPTPLNPIPLNPIPTPQPTLANPLSVNPAPVNLTLGTGGLKAQGGGFLETFDNPTSEFASYLFVGREEPWTGEFKDGRYQLSNGSDEGVAKYVYTTTLAGATNPLSSHVVSVDVFGTFTNLTYSQAGLLFYFNPETQYYYGFVVKGNLLALVLRDSNGFQELASTTTDALKVGQVNRLSIVPEANKVRLLINGAEIMSLDSPTSRAWRGRYFSSEYWRFSV